MDPLLVLTRSARPQKRQPKARAAQTPSAGPTGNPQLYNDTENLGSRKRKRGSETISASAVDRTDFFGNGAVSNVQEDSDVEVAIESRTAATAAAQTSLEERKRILKQHKLKVTVLDEREGEAAVVASQSIKKSKKKRSTEATTKDDRKQQRALYPEPLTDFGLLRQRYGVTAGLARNIAEQGFSLPTEVQMASLPLLLGGAAEQTISAGKDVDLLTVAPTGSGKTLAFLIPLIHKLQTGRHGLEEDDVEDGPCAIILAPTKELVNQIVNEGRKLCEGLNINIAAARKGLQVYGSRSSEAEVEKSISTPDIIVATPGALCTLLQHSDGTDQSVPETKSAVSTHTFPTVQHLVLDEADVLLDPLFRPQTLTVLSALPSPTLRLSLWSATISSTIEALLLPLLHSRSSTPAPLIRLVVGLKDSAVPNIAHRLTYCATERGKLLALRDLLVPKSASPSDGPALRAPFLVFTQTIERCTTLHNELKYDIPASAGGSSRIAVLHSELPDRVRERILTSFRKGEVWVLITTDLLARGVDFRGVNGVVNYDVPTSAAGYVHRVGRTGRAGREGGVAVTLYTREDVKYVKVVANVIAAAERARGKGEGERSVEQWLLDALPDVSKEDRKTLRTRGVEERRKGERKGRIPTKGGYRKGSSGKSMKGIGSKVKKQVVARDGAEDDFGGFSD